MIGILSVALGKVRNGLSVAQPFVTVIVAARDEEAVIGGCLDALIKQDYPPDRYEIIVADDRSTDATSSILSSYANTCNRMTTIRIDAVPAGFAPKKFALSKAIEKAQGEIILQTDADCAPPESWITGMVRRFEPGIGMIAGVAPYIKTRGVIAGFVIHEYFWNILLSAGSIVLGFGTHASGRNLAFRRELFNAVGGYGDAKNILSGDDTLLMQRIQHWHPGSIATNPSPESHVYTPPPSTMRAFIRQRIRHMSTGTKFHPLQIAIGGIVYGFHLGILAAFLGGIVSRYCLGVFLIAFFGKAICDAFAFNHVKRVFGLFPYWGTFILNELLMVLYLSLFPILGAITPVKWKENS